MNAPELETPMTTMYDEVGGGPFFRQLVDYFYEQVETDSILRPMYPADLTDSKVWLASFLSQYFGGPGDYSAAKGHPRLRMRHAHIKIGRRERDAWWNAMAAAVERSATPEPYRSAMLEYFTTSADWMINHDDQTSTEA